MTTPPEKTKISDDTKLSDLTVGEFRKMLDDMLQTALWTIEQTMHDPADEKMLASVPVNSHKDPDSYISLDELERELDLKDD